LYESTTQKLNKLTTDYKFNNSETVELSNLVAKTKAPGISEILAILYGECDHFNLFKIYLLL
jgi:hypothetical protein